MVPRESPLVADTLAYFSSIEKLAPRCYPATVLSLSRYERKYLIYNAKRKEAEAAAEAALQSFPLDPKKLDAYLSEYYKSPEQQNDWGEKQLNYKKALALLTQIATSDIADQATFLHVYEQLVGASEQSGLWHSGGLYRAKNTVAKHFKQFVDMVKDVRRHKDDPVEKGFAVALRHAKEIDGLGLNVTTEMLNTFAPSVFAVLNKNSAQTLEHLGCKKLGSLNKWSFSVEKYVHFNAIMTELAHGWKFHNLSQVDHFLNYVYWRHVKQS